MKKISIFLLFSISLVYGFTNCGRFATTPGLTNSSQRVSWQSVIKKFSGTPAVGQRFVRPWTKTYGSNKSATEEENCEALGFASNYRHGSSLYLLIATTSCNIEMRKMAFVEGVVASFFETAVADDAESMRALINLMQLQQPDENAVSRVARALLFEQDSPGRSRMEKFYGFVGSYGTVFFDGLLGQRPTEGFEFLHDSIIADWAPYLRRHPTYQEWAEELLKRFDSAFKERSRQIFFPRKFVDQDGVEMASGQYPVVPLDQVRNDFVASPILTFTNETFNKTLPLGAAVPTMPMVGVKSGRITLQVFNQNSVPAPIEIAFHWTFDRSKFSPLPPVTIPANSMWTVILGQSPEEGFRFNDGFDDHMFDIIIKSTNNLPIVGFLGTGFDHGLYDYVEANENIKSINQFNLESILAGIPPKCSVTTSQSYLNLSYSESVTEIKVSAAADCEWKVVRSEDEPWLKIENFEGKGDGLVRVSTTRNSGPSNYASFLINNSRVALFQAGVQGANESMRSASRMPAQANPSQCTTQSCHGQPVVGPVFHFSVTGTGKMPGAVIPVKKKVGVMRDEILLDFIRQMNESDTPPEKPDEPDPTKVAKECHRNLTPPSIPESLLKMANKQTQRTLACFQNALKGAWNSTAGLVVNACDYVYQNANNPQKVQQDLAQIWNLYLELQGIVASMYFDQMTFARTVAGVGQEAVNYCARGIDEFSKASPADQELMLEGMANTFCDLAGGTLATLGLGKLLSAGATAASKAEFINKFIQGVKTSLNARKSAIGSMRVANIKASARPPARGIAVAGAEIDEVAGSPINVEFKNYWNPNERYTSELINGSLAQITTDADFLKSIAGRSLNDPGAARSFFEAFRRIVTPKISQNTLGLGAGARNEALGLGFGAGEVATLGEGMCLENSLTAGSAAVKAGMTDVKVVVGNFTLREGGRTFTGPHAWIERGSDVYDVFNGIFTSRRDYYFKYDVFNTKSLGAPVKIKGR